MKKLLWVVVILVLLVLGGGIWFWQKYGTFVKMYLKMKPGESMKLLVAKAGYKDKTITLTCEEDDKTRTIRLIKGVGRKSLNIPGSGVF